MAELDLDWVALRAVLVYGPGVKGNMAQMMRLARSALPLPVAHLRARRSLLALENLTAAIVAVLEAPSPLRQVFVVADLEVLNIAEMIAAMRHGLGRRASVFPVPDSFLALFLRATGQEHIYQRVSGSLVVDPSALRNLRWAPPVATPIGLASLMRTAATH